MGTATGGGTYNYDTTVVVTAEEKIGYWFVNWTENGVVVSEEKEYSFTATADRTLVANFEPIDYWTFEELEIGMSEFKIGLLDNRGATHFELKIEGCGTQRKPIETYIKKPTILLGNPDNFEIRLFNSAEAEIPIAVVYCEGEPGDNYGKLIIHTFTVNFESKGGTEIDDIEVLNGATITAPDEPTKTGYDFAGWFKDENLTEAWDFATDQVFADITLFAKWDPRTDTPYTVKHYQQDVAGDGYTLVDTEELTGTTDATVAATPRIYTGFTLNESKSTLSGTVKPDGSLVLELYYDRLTFIVSFESNGGSEVDPIENVRYGATITEPEPPTRTGYIFAGWFKDEVLTNEWDFNNDIVTESITLYAKWESSAVTQVEMIIDSLPTVAALTLDNLNGVEEAEAAYDDLSDDEKQAVNTELVAKLNGAVEKITQLVLENVDATFNEAKDTINQQCTGTGIDRVEFANRKATFYIDDLEKIVYGFVSSGVTQLFESLYDDMNVIGMEIAGHLYPIEGGEMGALKAGARIVLVLLGHQEYIDEPTRVI